MMSIPIGYVYETVNLVTDKTYVGRRNLDRDKSWRQYLGSGKIVNQAIKKYGREKREERLASIEKPFKRAYLEDRLSCEEMQSMFSLKKRALYNLINDLNLPTFSNR